MKHPGKPFGRCASFTPRVEQELVGSLDRMSGFPDILLKKFWDRVQKADGCWTWIPKVQTYGYGYLYVAGGRLVRASRLSFMIHKGPIPKGLFVCHKCDNRRCVNPEHLYAGTQRQNMRDAIERERLPHGLAHCRAKLSDEQIIEIREARGVEPNRVTREKFGVTANYIYKIQAGVSRPRVSK